MLCGVTPDGGARSRALDGRGLRSLTFEPGEAYQFDWSHEIVLLNG